MSWLTALDKEMLQRLVQESRCSHLAVKPDGVILWVSDEFSEWSGYTESELIKIGWIAISKQDDSFAANMQAADEMRLGTRSYYTVQMAYVKKSGTPQWGVLTAKRVPEIGDLDFIWCHWTPIEGASDTAFALAMDYQQKLEVRIKDMAETIKVLTNQTEEERLVYSFGRIMLKYPRIFMMILIVLGGSTGGKFVIDVCERLGFIQPTKTEIVVPKGATIPDMRNTEGLALRRVSDEQASTADYRVTLADGSEVSWRLKDESLRGTKQRGSAVNAGRSSSSTGIAGDTTAGADELRNGAHDAVNRVSIGSEQTNGNQAF